jgi:hypothetical protein
MGESYENRTFGVCNSGEERKAVEMRCKVVLYRISREQLMISDENAYNGLENAKKSSIEQAIAIICANLRQTSFLEEIIVEIPLNAIILRYLQLGLLFFHTQCYISFVEC